MDFELKEEHRLLRRMAADFAKEHIVPVARELDIGEVFPLDILKKMAPLGLLGGPIPEELGGAGLDFLGYAIVMEEIGRACSSVRATLTAQLSLTGLILSRWGSERQKERWLPGLLRGEIIGCCALAEPEAGLNIERFLTRAEPTGDGWLLSGKKSSVLNGGVSDLAIVFARIPGERAGGELSAYLLEAGRPGFSREAIKDKVGLRAVSLADLSFKDCPLGPEDLLGNTEAGEELFRSALEEGQFSSAAGSLGLAQASLDAATEYSLERKAFGRAIAGFQLVQDMIARMVVDVEAARLMVYRAAVLKDSGAPAGDEVAMAKHFASASALRAAEDALQVHGGYGYSNEYPVERYLRDARAASLFEGTTREVQQAISLAHLRGQDCLSLPTI